MFHYSKQMGSITRFRRLQPSSFGMLYYLFRFVSSTHAEAKEVCHLVSYHFPCRAKTFVCVSMSGDGVQIRPTRLNFYFSHEGLD